MHWQTQGFATKRLRGGGSSGLAEPGDLWNSIVTHAVGSRQSPAGIRCQKEAEGKCKRNDQILTFTNSASEMTYIVSSGALNSTHSLTHVHQSVDNLGLSRKSRPTCIHAVWPKM